MKKIIESTCGKLCPATRDLRMQVAELKHDVANRDAEIRRLENALVVLSGNKDLVEIRLAKIRQLCWGVLEEEERDGCTPGPKITGGP